MLRLLITSLLILSTNAFSAQLEPIYGAGGTGNQDYRFEMLVIVKDVSLLSQPNLHIQPEYASLNSSNASLYPSSQEALIYSMPDGTKFLRVAFEGLEPTTMYRARVTLSRLDGPQFVELAISDWYYTTTTGPDPKSIVRSDMILKGMKEFSESEHGFVGAGGTVDVDGTRYGADVGELWCSEFYAWTGNRYLIGISELSSVKRLTTYFTGHGGWMGRDQIAEKARRGDYLSMDTDLDGEANHSGMFLAYEVENGTPYVWTLEGNSGNKVKVHRRVLDGVIVGLGHIMNSQFSVE